MTSGTKCMSGFETFYREEILGIVMWKTTRHCKNINIM